MVEVLEAEMKVRLLIILLCSIANPLTLQQAIEQYRQSPSMAFWGRYAATYKLGERYEWKLRQQIDRAESKYWDHLLNKFILTRTETVTKEIILYSDTPWRANPERTPPVPDPNTPPLITEPILPDPNHPVMKALLEIKKGNL